MMRMRRMVVAMVAMQMTAVVAMTRLMENVLRTATMAEVEVQARVRTRTTIGLCATTKVAPMLLAALRL